MADLPSISGPKVNDIEVAQEAPITEALEAKFGGLINGLLAGSGGNYEEFLSSRTFNVPEQVTRVLVVGCGGGGSGAADTGGTVTYANGGDAAPYVIRVVSVVPDTPISVVIGGGGAGVAVMSGNNGINSSFGSLIFPGGLGGLQLTNTMFEQDRPGNGGSRGGRVFIGNSTRFSPAEGNNGFFGGTSGTNGGGGGAGPFGNGTNTASGSSSAAANSGAGSGAGGGTTGNGGSGRIIVFW